MASGASVELDRLRTAASGCRNCDLWRNATQTVFGEGPARAEIVLVGEQPGDQEDRKGHVFVGPAGRVLDDALASAGIDRAGAYVTNAVKHFKWEPRGKRRIHKKPDLGEISACEPWLTAELEVVRPRVVVCLGAVAARSLLGAKVRVTVDRGRLLSLADGTPAVVTAHPSSILRGPVEERDAAMAALVSDLRLAADLVAAEPQRRG